MVTPDRDRVAAERRSMNRPPYELGCDSRTRVLKTLREVCLHRSWNLLAAPVRSSHVHVMVEA